ncbi:hypothetical protein BC831DRAFT_8538 [Entophlyctis helioformis]|nr:hypothetical protein BC831DRAFT_8538 [Entophlyctis helioformis]
MLDLKTAVRTLRQMPAYAASSLSTDQDEAAQELLDRVLRILASVGMVLEASVEVPAGLVDGEFLPLVVEARTQLVVARVLAGFHDDEALDGFGRDLQSESTTVRQPHVKALRAMLVEREREIEKKMEETVTSTQTLADVYDYGEFHAAFMAFIGTLGVMLNQQYPPARVKALTQKAALKGKSPVWYVYRPEQEAEEEEEEEEEEEAQEAQQQQKPTFKAPAPAQPSRLANLPPPPPPSNTGQSPAPTARPAATRTGVAAGPSAAIVSTPRLATNQHPRVKRQWIEKITAIMRQAGRGGIDPPAPPHPKKSNPNPSPNANANANTNLSRVQQLPASLTTPAAYAGRSPSSGPRTLTLGRGETAAETAARLKNEIEQRMYEVCLIDPAFYYGLGERDRASVRARGWVMPETGGGSGGGDVAAASGRTSAEPQFRVVSASASASASANANGGRGTRGVTERQRAAVHGSEPASSGHAKGAPAAARERVPAMRLPRVASAPVVPSQVVRELQEPRSLQPQKRQIRDESDDGSDKEFIAVDDEEADDDEDDEDEEEEEEEEEEDRRASGGRASSTKQPAARKPGRPRKSARIATSTAASQESVDKRAGSAAGSGRVTRSRTRGASQS